MSWKLDWPVIAFGLYLWIPLPTLTENLLHPGDMARNKRYIISNFVPWEVLPITKQLRCWYMWIYTVCSPSALSSPDTLFTDQDNWIKITLIFPSIPSPLATSSNHPILSTQQLTENTQCVKCFLNSEVTRRLLWSETGLRGSSLKSKQRKVQQRYVKNPTSEAKSVQTSMVLSTGSILAETLALCNNSSS